MSKNSIDRIQETESNKQNLYVLGT